MYDYLTLKMLPLIGSGVDKNIKLPSFRPIAQKPHLFQWEKFSCKMSIFLTMDSKDDNFLIRSTPEPMVRFLGL